MEYFDIQSENKWLTLWTRISEPFRSVKVSITICVLAAIVAAIALTSFVLLRVAEVDTLAAQRERNLGEGVRTASTLARRIVELQRALAVTAELLDPATLHDPARLEAFVTAKPVLRGLFSNLFAAGADGRVLLFAKDEGLQHPVLNIGQRDYFKDTLAERRAIVSAPIAGGVSDEPVVVFTQPLKQQGSVFGVIGGGLRLQKRDLLDELTDGQNGDSDPLVVITDARGHILSHPQRSRIMASIASEPRMAEGYAAWLAMGGADGGAVEPSGLHLPQPGQVLSVAGVPGPDWLVWRALPESELLAPLEAGRRKALLWAAGVVAGASLLVLALIGRLLRPLLLLKDRAATLFDASADVHAGWPESSGEIGELTRVLRHVCAERAQLEQFNSQVLARLDLVMAAAPLGILFTRNQRFELATPEACRLLGLPEHELLGTPASAIFASNEDYEALGPLVLESFTNEGSYAGEWRFMRAGSEAFHGQLRGRPVERDNPAAGTIWTLADVDEQVEARQHLEWSASHDALTGLGNRKLFEKNVQRLIAAGADAMPAALVMIDLDHFKPINDSAGHAAGDAMLIAVAQAITSHVRANDLVARLGGDEFVLLLERCPTEAAGRVAASVRDAIVKAVVHWDGRALSVGASIGVAALRAETASAQDWVQQADAACYEAKAAGRGVVRTAGVPARRVVAGSEA